MIVPPNFLDDWRMDVLAHALGNDALAPLYVLRLWSWCQNEKRWQFPDFGVNHLRAICKALHEPEAFMEAMEKAGYAERFEEGFSSSAWAALNGQLIAAWKNGKTGGRPKKPTGNPTDNQRGNRTETVGLTDKTGQEKKEPPVAPSVAPTPPPPAAPPPAPKPPPAPPAPPPAPAPPGVDLFGTKPGRTPKPKPKSVDSVSQFLDSRPSGVSEQVWGEWLAYRLEMSSKNKSAPFTAPAIKGVGNYLKRCNDIGETSDEALLRSMANGWKVPYPDREMAAAFNRRISNQTFRRPTANDQHAAAGAALAGFGREPSTHGARHGNYRADPSEAEDIDFREQSGPTE